MRYMLLLYLEERRPGGFERMMEYQRAAEEAGVLVASDPLHDPDRATTVRIREGETLNVDGPFAETTEWLGGYFILDCADLDAALEWAARCPTAEIGSVEVRPIMET
jgi:hypothetical protein